MNTYFPETSEIGEFVYSWDFDQDEYEEYLEDNELESSKEALTDYIYNEVNFEVEFLDNDFYHEFHRCTAKLYDIENAYGEKLAQTMLDDCMKHGNGRVETLLLFEEDVDLNNPNELNDAAKKVLRHGDYEKGCRGFILSDGTVVYTPDEHNRCTAINGVKNTFHFITLGNIRVLPQSIDVGKKPTAEQRNVLRQVVAAYSDDVLYMDIFSDGGEYSATYHCPQYNLVIGEIDRFYNEGIKPKGKLMEGKTKKKTVVISETDVNKLIENTLQEAFYPNADQVLLIKDYLDKNFVKNELDSIDINGYPTKEKGVMLLSVNKQPLKSMNFKELLRMIDDKFIHLIKKDDDRKKFIKAVITDWYNGNIQPNGILSVNYI